MDDDDQQRRKRIRRTTLDQLEEGRSRVFPVLETIVSEGDQGENSSTLSNSTDDFLSSDDDEFYSGDIESGVDDFSEFVCEYDYDQVEEDGIDPDELSYEELLALGEMVGVENTGLSEAEINQHLQPLTCLPSSINFLIDRCVVCQVEYEEGENLVGLHCDHLYHRDCIAQWLQIKKVCPICNNELQMSKPNN